MKKTFKIWSALILFLFLFPVIIQFLPDNKLSSSTKLVKEPAMIVYASNIIETKVPETKDKKALLYFTHNHEAYKPVTKAKNGKVTTSHQSENIVKFGEKLQTQLDFNGIQTDILPLDNMAELEKREMLYDQSYNSIRPHVQKRLEEADYDLIIDLHRDSIGADLTTAVHNGEKYAKVAFVVGLDHPNSAENKLKAQRLKDEMEKLVPGITRGLLLKSGKGVDGKYNQDLHPSIILIELGGSGNSEEQLNRTVAVIGKAAASTLSE